MQVKLDVYGGWQHLVATARHRGPGLEALEARMSPELGVFGQGAR